MGTRTGTGTGQDASSGPSPASASTITAEATTPNAGAGISAATPLSVGGSDTGGAGGIKRSAEPELGPESLDDSASKAKKKKTAPASRGVANLTPEQLAKKRANDREAQRAIRERTKNQIEKLEQRIQELTDQKPYQELQAALQAKEATEKENAQIKQQLMGIVGVLQSLIGSAATLNAYNTLIPTPAYHSSPQPPPSQMPLHNAESHAGASAAQSGSAMSTQSDAQSRYAVPPLPTSQDNTGYCPAAVSSTCGSTYGGEDGQQQAQRLDKQRLHLRHNLDMGPERLELDFVLHPDQRPSRIQNGVNGAQDMPNFHHVPMKHDWTAVPREEALQARPHAWESPERTEKHIPGGMHRGVGNANDGYVDSPEQRGRRGHGASDLGSWSGVGSTPRYAAPVRNSDPTCPLDALLLDFLRERRQRVAEGMPAHEIVGPRYPSVSSLLNPANSVYSHPLSKVFTDILSTFPDISALPERVAVLYVMFLVMRWQVSPTRENYERLPEWMLPSESQLLCAHPAWIDHLPFPAMREKLARDYNPVEYLFDNFFIPYTTTLTLSWPYEEVDALLRSPDSDELLINPVFERHLRNLDNWKLGDAFAKAFPNLADMGNIDSRPPRRATTTTTAASTPRPTSSASPHSR